MTSRVPHPLPARPASPKSPAPLPSTLAASHAQAKAPEPNRPPHRLLDVFYREHKALADLLPTELIARVEDTPSYVSFVRQTIVATCAIDEHDDEGWRALQQLQYEARDAVTVGMQDAIHTRIFAQHTKKLAKARQAPGTWTSSTPKNVLCLGYRPVRLLLLATETSARRMLPIDITTSRHHRPACGTDTRLCSSYRSMSTDRIRSGRETQPKL
ncbi:BQ2448_1508 [Microbotryum intermedium]|uniref:BQ2448_1508 protein n=1 Tax=Microbotryum intermedium TaxID=269621 RepID=A0A238FE04_9BASI|nr:BQ2448_1508 [Microbotryum intermedium]